MKSDFLSLNLRDGLKGLAVVVISAVITAVLTIIENKGLYGLKESVGQIATVAITSGLAYILKNFLSDENDRIGGII